MLVVRVVSAVIMAIRKAVVLFFLYKSKLCSSIFGDMEPRSHTSLGVMGFASISASEAETSLFSKCVVCKLKYCSYVLFLKINQYSCTKRTNAGSYGGIPPLPFRVSRADIASFIATSFLRRFKCLDAHSNSMDLLKLQLDNREPDDPCSYLLAIWTPGETSNSIEPPEKSCGFQEFASRSPVNRNLHPGSHVGMGAIILCEEQWANLFREECMWNAALLRNFPFAGYAKRWPGPIPRGLSKRLHLLTYFHILSDLVYHIFLSFFSGGILLYISVSTSFHLKDENHEIVGHIHLFLKEQLEISTMPTPAGILHGPIIGKQHR
ncbi:hypothetical protein RHMOL_Rhmol12G0125600 [Rhododendron molle]|uniref:Uncharacterized protein n=1 Tax=Rhododendron molle TaxID=49168 RepID=A0ACC0LH64_RHOML|nr:hypothetical protein RHMOL_Rhmol12G0125600 [Rhododendron molle]